MSPKSFYEKYYPYAEQAAKKLGHLSAGVILAQWALETGFGSSDVAVHANNLAGIKANTSVKDGTYGNYAKFNSLNSWVNGYVHVMSLSYYSGVRSATSPTSQITALDKSPWATDPKYGSKVTGTYNELSPFFRVSHSVGGGSKPTTKHTTKPSKKSPCPCCGCCGCGN